MRKEFIPCRKCIHQKPSPIPNGYYITKSSDGYEVVKECQHHKDWLKEEKLFLNFIRGHFDREKYDLEYPRDYKGTNSIESVNRLVNYLQGFSNNSKIRQSILYFTGPNGTQKTSVANWVGKSLLKKSFYVVYYTMKKLIDNLWAAERDETEKRFLDQILRSDLLILDESFDKSKALIWESGKQIGLVDSFIRDRINLNKGIIFISNNKISDIEKNGFSKSLQELILRETKKIDSVLLFEDNYLDNLNELPERIF